MLAILGKIACWTLIVIVAIIALVLVSTACFFAYSIILEIVRLGKEHYEDRTME